MQKEQWKQYEDTMYLVSDYGNVYSNITECILKQDISQRYNRVVLRYKGIAVTHSVHRMVANTFLPNPMNKPQINHIDGNRQNNCLDNLEWCTQSENQQHAYEIGLQVGRKGILHHNARLTEENVLEIKFLLESGEFSAPEIADLFCVQQQLISKINKGHRWSHVTGWKPENRKEIKVDYGKFLAKLTAKDIPKIRQYFLEKYSDKDIANLYGVHQGTINAIRNNKTWKNF